jgi:glutamate racemase
VILGIFDSGLGGLTVVRRVRALLPHVDIVFLADQAHVPYGDRTADDLAGLLAQNVAYLTAAGADAIVMGCNTTCAVAAERGWPDAGMPILDLIDAAAEAVVVSGARRVGVLATAATTRSGAYGNAIRARDPATYVEELAAPRLVPLVEAGTLSGPLARDAVADAVAGFSSIDALVLACTHYPLLDDEFAAVLGANVVRIDPAVAQAERAAAFVRNHGGDTGTGRTRYVTTGALAPFERALGSLGLGRHDVVEHVSATLARR